MNSITSAELNYLVFRYLQESGLTHSAFAFGNETSVNNFTIDHNSVPNGSLIKLIQKGLQYLEMEVNMNCQSETDDDFSFIQPLDLITNDVCELRKIINARKKIQRKGVVDQECEGELSRKTEREKTDRIKGRVTRPRSKRVTVREKKDMKKECEKDVEIIQMVKHTKKKQEHHTDKKMFLNKEDVDHVKTRDDKTFGEPEQMDICASISKACALPSSDAIILEGHTSEICACAWNPSGALLASGSGDSTARIWNVAKMTDGANLQGDPGCVLVLKHGKDEAGNKLKDVTTLDWNCDGSLLATGSYDGQAIIWASDGELRSALTRHKGPIFSIKWNKKGNYILSGSCDTTAVVWDAKANESKQFEFHSGAILDTDWKDDSSFATCSTDTTIHVCEIGESRPIRTYTGHQGEVNSVKWDPTGSVLASCSDDMTAKIWSLKQDNFVHDLKDHTKAIYAIRWSPSGTATSNPNKQLVLASASFDSTVKIWDVELGRLISTLNGHRDAVYSIAFSPNAEYLASGSMDNCLHIWSLKEGKIVKTFGCDGSIFEVCWNREGNKIAACTNSSKICILDFRM